MSGHRVLWFAPDRPVDGTTVYVRSGVCPVPSRWVLDELARGMALEAAERELDAARDALYHFDELVEGGAAGAALDRYVVALEARNALRDGGRG